MHRCARLSGGQGSARESTGTLIAVVIMTSLGLCWGGRWYGSGKPKLKKSGKVTIEFAVRSFGQLMGAQISTINGIGTSCS